MVGMVHSSYYRKPSLGKKGNKPSKNLETASKCQGSHLLTPSGKLF